MKKFLAIFALLGAAVMYGQAPDTVYPVDYQPPPCTGIFNDVPCPPTPEFPYSNYIEQLYAETFTVGTGNGTFSPSSPIPRAQMAVWVIKAEHSILERFATGQVRCPVQGDWAKCTATQYDARVRAESVVMLTYRTRGSDDQIPARVVTIFDGGFEYEIQTDQKADYLAYLNDQLPVTE